MGLYGGYIGIGMQKRGDYWRDKRSSYAKLFEEYKQSNPYATYDEFQNWIKAQVGDESFLRGVFPADDLLKNLAAENAQRKQQDELKKQLGVMTDQLQVQSQINSLLRDELIGEDDPQAALGNLFKSLRIEEDPKAQEMITGMAGDVGSKQKRWRQEYMMQNMNLAMSAMEKMHAAGIPVGDVNSFAQLTGLDPTDPRTRMLHRGYQQQFQLELDDRARKQQQQIAQVNSQLWSNQMLATVLATGDPAAVESAKNAMRMAYRGTGLSQGEVEKHVEQAVQGITELGEVSIDSTNASRAKETYRQLRESSDAKVKEWQTTVAQIAPETTEAGRAMRAVASKFIMPWEALQQAASIAQRMEGQGKTAADIAGAIYGEMDPALRNTLQPIDSDTREREIKSRVNETTMPSKSFYAVKADVDKYLTSEDTDLPKKISKVDQQIMGQPNPSKRQEAMIKRNSRLKSEIDRIEREQRVIESTAADPAQRRGHWPEPEVVRLVNKLEARKQELQKLLVTSPIPEPKPDRQLPGARQPVWSGNPGEPQAPRRRTNTNR